MAIVTTLVLVLAANQIGDIGGRIPYVFLVLWFGSATIVALVFVPRKTDTDGRDTQVECGGWRVRIGIAAAALAPLMLVPLLEIRRTGHDPMIWLMEMALVISICSTPYFALVSGKVLSAAVLTWGAITVLWLPCAAVLFEVIKRAELAKVASTVDTANTMHAFFAPEYRYLFYILSAAVLFLYCPVMFFLGYRRFQAMDLVDRVSQPE